MPEQLQHVPVNPDFLLSHQQPGKKLYDLARAQIGGKFTTPPVTPILSSRAREIITPRGIYYRERLLMFSPAGVNREEKRVRPCAMGERKKGIHAALMTPKKGSCWARRKKKRAMRVGADFF